MLTALFVGLLCCAGYGRCKLNLDGFGDPADKYFSNEELEAYLHAYAEKCSDVAKLIKVGVTAKGTAMYGLEISDNTGELEPEPYFRYIANMHGDEPTGRVHLVKLAEWLCEKYRTGDPRAVRMVEDMHTVLVPTMNPDGFAAGTRQNSNHVDLNRDFPDRFKSDSMEPTGKEQAETQAIIALSDEYPFVAAANLHEGALVANYPWDATEDGKSRYNAAPDDKAFRFYAHLYADTHRTMHEP